MIAQITTLFESCATSVPLFPQSELYNETWLLRLVLDWFSRNRVPAHPLNFEAGARWYSQAWLPSAFLRRPGGDPLAESWTHADGAIGHFGIGREGKNDLALARDATQLVILEAKLFSGLSSRVKNARYFDQAARTVACMAQVLNIAGRNPSDMSRLGFYLLAPQSRIDRRKFGTLMEKGSICRQVELRVSEYGGELDLWYWDWFVPAVEKADIHIISWEQLLAEMARHDSTSADPFRTFYKRCLAENGRTTEK